MTKSGAVKPIKKDDVLIARKDLGALYDVLHKLSLKESPVAPEVKWRVGKAMKQVSNEIQVLNIKQSDLCKKYKNYIGNNQYTTRMVTVTNEETQIKETKADEVSDVAFNDELTHFVETKVVITIPKIPYELVSGMLDGRDIEFVSGIFAHDSGEDQIH